MTMTTTADRTQALAGIMAELGSRSDDPEEGLRALAAIASPAVCKLVAEAMAESPPDQVELSWVRTRSGKGWKDTSTGHYYYGDAPPGGATSGTQSGGRPAPQHDDPDSVILAAIDLLIQAHEGGDSDVVGEQLAQLAEMLGASDEVQLSRTLDLDWIATGTTNSKGLPGWAWATGEGKKGPYRYSREKPKNPPGAGRQKKAPEETAAGKKKAAAEASRQAKLEAKTKSTELAKAIGEAGTATREQAAELIKHMGSLTVEQLKQLKTHLGAKLTGAKRKQEIADALRVHVEGLAGTGAPAAKVTAKPAPAPEEPATPATGINTSSRHGDGANPDERDEHGVQPLPFNDDAGTFGDWENRDQIAATIAGSVADYMEKRATEYTAPTLDEMYDSLKESHPTLTVPQFRSAMMALQRADVVGIFPWSGGAARMPHTRTGWADGKNSPQVERNFYVGLRKGMDGGAAALARARELAAKG